ncbi:hypothetical protein B0H16DRAFT_1479797 [Mycena metata]|uniref:Uncharacterized protein n=1 Tax=Mycena metata TaxID=1033252 RepID=A0AAD7MDB6_9AGAR|nr:hypothetical protein B0H16DRAFT_1479797 [Mycena metata]
MFTPPDQVLCEVSSDGRKEILKQYAKADSGRTLLGRYAVLERCDFEEEGPFRQRVVLTWGPGLRDAGNTFNEGGKSSKNGCWIHVRRAFWGLADTRGRIAGIAAQRATQVINLSGTSDLPYLGITWYDVVGWFSQSRKNPKTDKSTPLTVGGGGSGNHDSPSGTSWEAFGLYVCPKRLWVGLLNGGKSFLLAENILFNG